MGTLRTNVKIIGMFLFFYFFELIVKLKIDLKVQLKKDPMLGICLYKSQTKTNAE